MTSYFDHNAHITRRDKTQSATSWDLYELLNPEMAEKEKAERKKHYQESLKKYEELLRQLHTYGGKKAGER